MEKSNSDSTNCQQQKDGDLVDYAMPDDYSEDFATIEIKQSKVEKEEKKCKDKPKLTKAEKIKQSKKKDRFFIARMFIMTFCLSILFSVVSELVLSGGNMIISIILLFLLVGISITFDIIGTAAASTNIEPFISKASRKDKRALIALRLLKNAEKVSSFCNDVVGDICGIVSGACLSAIVISLVKNGGTTLLIVNVAFSAVVSAMTVGGKAIGKLVAIRDGEKIISMVARVMSIFQKA